MRITLIISSLSCGGAEKNMTLLANYRAGKGDDVTLLTFDSGSKPSFYSLDDSVCHRALNIAGDSQGLFGALKNNLKRIRVLRKAIRESRPDIVISFLDSTNILTLLASRGMRVPVVISERNDPYMAVRGMAWRMLRGWIYPLADCLVVQTQSIATYFPEKIRRKIHIIPNPVMADDSEDKNPAIRIGRPAIVAMGKFHRQKGFDILLRAFAGLQHKHKDWTLTIFGDGALRPELEGLRDSLGLSDRVFLPGRVKHPQYYIRQADIFVMPSRYEGFPNALCEAMACGVPVIATACRSGATDIIRNGVDGMLVPADNVDALADAMDRLMVDETARKNFSLRALEIVDRFSFDSVMHMWDNVIEKI